MADVRNGLATRRQAAASSRNIGSNATGIDLREAENTPTLSLAELVANSSEISLDKRITVAVKGMALIIRYQSPTPEMSQPIQRRSLRKQVATHLFDMILNHELLPGDRVVEGRIARQLGIAQNTLREGLLDLEHQGLVIKYDGRGTYVTKYTLRQIEDIYGVRLHLEPRRLCWRTTNWARSIPFSSTSRLRKCKRLESRGTSLEKRHPYRKFWHGCCRWAKLARAAGTRGSEG